MVVTGTHDPYLVALSILVACFASYTALDLAGHVGAARGLARRAWLVAAAITMGGGIWSMHCHARLHHADAAVLRHRIDHPFARGGYLRNRRRLLHHQSRERIAASPRSQWHLHGTWHCRHALH